MKYVRIKFIRFIYLAISLFLVSSYADQIYPAKYEILNTARRVRAETNLGFLDSIDWQAISGMIEEKAAYLCAEFSDKPRWKFRDALHQAMMPETEEKSSFVLKEAPTANDLRYITDLNLDHEVSILYIPRIDTWFLVRGNGKCAELPDNLEKIYKAGLVGSFGHLHYRDFWPLPSPPDIDMVAKYGGFEWVIADVGICVYGADNLINPQAGKPWSAQPDNIEDLSPKNLPQEEDEVFAVVRDFFERINLDFTILLWAELNDRTIVKIETPNLVNNLHSPNDIIRAQALTGLVSLLDTEALSILKIFSQDPSSYVRQRAIDLFLDMDTGGNMTEAIDVAQAYLYDEDFSIRTEALDFFIQASNMQGLSEKEPIIVNCLRKMFEGGYFLNVFSKLSSLKAITDQPNLVAVALSKIVTPETIDRLQYIVNTADIREETEVRLALYCLDSMTK